MLYRYNYCCYSARLLFLTPAFKFQPLDHGFKGTAVKELYEECGISVSADELIDMTELACQEATDAGHLPYAGIAPSSGACDEVVRFFYLERSVTTEMLNSLKNKLISASEFSEFITLHVVPWDRVWKMSGDSKTIM